MCAVSIAGFQRHQNFTLCVYADGIVIDDGCLPILPTVILTRVYRTLPARRHRLDGCGWFGGGHGESLCVCRASYIVIVLVRQTLLGRYY